MNKFNLKAEPLIHWDGSNGVTVAEAQEFIVSLQAMLDQYTNNQVKSIPEEVYADPGHNAETRKLSRLLDTHAFTDIGVEWSSINAVIPAADVDKYVRKLAYGWRLPTSEEIQWLYSITSPAEKAELQYIFAVMDDGIIGFNTLFVAHLDIQLSINSKVRVWTVRSVDVPTVS